MAGAIFPRIKVWISAEDVIYSDLNAEFDNILDNLIPAQLDDYSSTVGEMQTSTDPGEVGTESLPTTFAGELERLRFTIKEMKGDVAQWYTTGATSFSEIAAALGSTLDNNRVSSGLSRADSNQPVYLVPNGATNSFKADGDTTNLVYFVNGTAVTISTEVTVTGVGLAPSSNNTALVNDTAIADGEETKLTGEYGSVLTIDAAGTEITALTGGLAAFKINDGASDEYFIARVKSSTELTEVRRGYFFDSTSAPVPRLAVADNDTITLLRTTWVFGKSDGTIATSTAEPAWSAVEPGTPTTDDYWFDMVNNTWKKYSGVAFVSADATFLGIVVSDSANTIGARSLEFAGTPTDINSISLEKSSVTIVRAVQNRATIGIYTQTIRYNYDNPTWDITADLESGVSETSSTMYYLYVTEDGGTKISDLIPYDRTADMRGYFHPYHVWRCVGQVFNDSGSDLENPETFDGVKTVFPTVDSPLVTVTTTESPYTVKERDEVIIIDAVSGAVTINMPLLTHRPGRKLIFKRTDKGYIDVDTFTDGNVTTGTDSIAVTAHPFASLQEIRLTNSGGALPTGLAAATDYYVIRTDDNNIKLASSKANAVAGTAVDITAAAGGGTHTITSEVNTVTLDGDASELIAGATTYLLHTLDETVTLQDAASQWEVMDHQTAMDWINDGVISIDATTTAPTKATGINIDQVRWRREGNFAHLEYSYSQSNATSAAAGSGDYKYALPSFLTADTTDITLYTEVIGNANDHHATNIIGSGTCSGNNNAGTVDCSLFDSTNFRGFFVNDATLGAISSASNFNLNTTTVTAVFRLTIPISGWNK